MWLQEGKGRSRGKVKGICEGKDNIKLKLSLHMPWKHTGGADR